MFCHLYAAFQNLVLACQLTVASSHNKGHNNVLKHSPEPKPRRWKKQLIVPRDPAPIPMIRPLFLHLHGNTTQDDGLDRPAMGLLEPHITGSNGLQERVSKATRCQEAATGKRARTKIELSPPSAQLNIEADVVNPGLSAFSHGPRPSLPLPTSLDLLFYLISLLKALHPSHGIAYPLFAGVEGMALAAYLNPDLRLG